MSDEELSSREVEIAIQFSALALISTLAEIGESKVATVIAAAMQAYYADDKEQGAKWLAELSEVAEKVKAEYELTKIEWPNTIN